MARVPLPMSSSKAMRSWTYRRFTMNNLEPSSKDGRRPFCFTFMMVAMASLFASCGGMSSAYNTPASNVGFGKSHLLHYYLPEARIQVLGYRVKLGRNDNLHFGVRSLVVADTSKPIQLVHNYSFIRDDRLRVVLSPEGLLEQVSLRRDPRIVESAVAVARAALSVTAPVPVPFKGGEDYPEFSKVLFRQEYKLNEITNKWVKIPVSITLSLSETNAGPPIRYVYVTARQENSSHQTGCVPCSVEGLYHRPLVPVVVEIVESSVDLGRNAGGDSFDDGVGVVSRRQETIYCPDSERVERIELAKAWLAPISYVARFSGGTLYDLSVVRKSDLLALTSAPADLLSPYFSLPSSLFHFEVNHHGPGQAGTADVEEVGGDDKPGGNPRPIIKN